MTRTELDSAFSECLKRKSAALEAADRAAVLETSAELLRLAREILAGVNAAGKPAHLAPEQEGALFWAAYHPVKLAPAGQGASAMIRFADEVEWMQSIGHAFTPKERKIVDELPFCGVPELFRRWVERQLAAGFGEEPASKVRIVFNWYRDHPTEAIPEELVAYLAENLDRDRQWFPFYYGELLSRLGRGAEQAQACSEAVKQKPSDFRRWIALGECNSQLPRRIVACLAKALTCTILPADRAAEIRASLEKRLRAAANLIGRTAPAKLDQATLERLAEPTHEFLVAGVPVTRGTYLGARQTRDGKLLASLGYVDAFGQERQLEVPMPEGLANRPRGMALKLRLVNNDGVDKLIELQLPPAKPATKASGRSPRPNSQPKPKGGPRWAKRR